MVPPALVADIGGGTFPAVINILLALRQREQTGQGCHLDIAMADTMFAFAWHALAKGYATGRIRKPERPLAGGSPRYRIYPTRDGKFVACGALEEKFWVAFLPRSASMTAQTTSKIRPRPTSVAKIIAGKTAEHWRPELAAADCCATIVASLEEAPPTRISSSAACFRRR